MKEAVQKVVRYRDMLERLFRSTLQEFIVESKRCMKERGKEKKAFDVDVRAALAAHRAIIDELTWLYAELECYDRRPGGEQSPPSSRFVVNSDNNGGN